MLFHGELYQGCQVKRVVVHFYLFWLFPRAVVAKLLWNVSEPIHSEGHNTLCKQNDFYLSAAKNCIQCWGNRTWWPANLFPDNWGIGERPPNTWWNERTNVWARLTTHFRVRQKCVPAGKSFNTLVAVEGVKLLYVFFYSGTGNKLKVTPRTIEECWLEALANIVRH